MYPWEVAVGVINLGLSTNSHLRRQQEIQTTTSHSTKDLLVRHGPSAKQPSKN